jgi:hypothetical protein
MRRRDVSRLPFDNCSEALAAAQPKIEVPDALVQRILDGVGKRLRIAENLSQRFVRTNFLKVWL